MIKELLGKRDGKVSVYLAQSGDRLDIRGIVGLEEGAGEQFSLDGSVPEIEGMVERAADEVMKIANPYVLANYYFYAELKRCNETKTPCDQARAISLFKHIVSTKPNDEKKWAYLGWGRVLADQNAFVGQVDKVRLAIELDSKFAPAYLSWGMALDDQGHHSEAIDYFRRATELEPTYSAAFYRWGRALLNQARQSDALKAKALSDDALAVFRKAVTANPDDYNSQFVLGLLLSDSDRRAASRQFGVAFEKMRVPDPQLFFSWGETYRALNMQSEAGAKFREAVEVASDAPELLSRVCEALRGMEETQVPDRCYGQAASQRSPNQ